MKLRISSCDKTVFLKDVTRFLPLWALYFIGGVLVMLTGFTVNTPSIAVSDLDCLIGPFAWINLIYAALCAFLLFGDLFQSRLCNALHALPLRREHWFASHILAGLCFSLIPNLLGILVILPRLQYYWYTVFFWLLGMELEFLFFFGLAVFCVMLSGSRFAAVAVYAIFNSLAYIAYWFLSAVYEPLLYGIRIDAEPFWIFSPVIHLTSRYDFFHVTKTAPSVIVLGSDWWYLAVLAVLGIGFGVLALQLYRRRDLECAGDFMAVRQCKPVFLLLYTLCFGAAAALFGQLFFNAQTVFLIVGLILGWFTGLMLLQRSVKVFKLRSFLGVGLLAAVMLASVLITRLDPLGITRKTPLPEHVEKIQFSVSGREATVSDPAHIQSLLDVHEQIIRKGPPSGSESRFSIYFCYTLKDGTLFTRYYYTSKHPSIAAPLSQLLKEPEVVLGYADSDWETFLESVYCADISLHGSNSYTTTSLTNPEKLRSLLEAIRLDCLQSDMSQQSLYGYDTRSDVAYIRLAVGYGKNQSIRIFKTSANTIAWLKEYDESFRG